MASAKLTQGRRSTFLPRRRKSGASAPIRRQRNAGKSRHRGAKQTSSFSALPKAKALEVSEIRNRLGVSQDELARITGYSIRAIAGWEAGKKLSEAARQKVVETERLRAALAEIVPTNELGDWLRSPNSAFEGQSPIQVIERGETDRLWRMIIQIEAGVAS